MKKDPWFWPEDGEIVTIEHRVSMTPTEAVMVGVMAKRWPHYTPKQIFASALWGGTEYPDTWENQISVHLSEINRKFREANLSIHIDHKYEVGHRFTEALRVLT